MANDIKVTVVVLSMDPIGSLEIYGEQTIQEANDNAPLTEFFWRDSASPQGFGPFDYISQAVEHYKMTVQKLKDMPMPEKEVPGELIRIDFQSRKRVN